MTLHLMGPLVPRWHFSARDIRRQRQPSEVAAAVPSGGRGCVRVRKHGSDIPEQKAPPLGTAAATSETSLVPKLHLRKTSGPGYLLPGRAQRAGSDSPRSQTQFRNKEMHSSANPVRIGSTQPRVARSELPWVTGPWHPTLKGLNQRPRLAVLLQPLQGWLERKVTQGRRCYANPGLSAHNPFRVADVPSFPNSIWERNCPRNSIAPSPGGRRPPKTVAAGGL